jgi:hypothetical protein
MAMFWPQHRLSRFLLGSILGVAVIVCLLYGYRFDHPIIFCYGAPLEHSGGRVISVLNPLRDRKDEILAENAIRDLGSPQCEQLVRERLAGADPQQICPVLHSNVSAKLIWIEPQRENGHWRNSRKLLYDLGAGKPRLVIYCGYSDAGWGVKLVSLQK